MAHQARTESTAHVDALASRVQQMQIEAADRTRLIESQAQAVIEERSNDIARLKKQLAESQCQVNQLSS